jgi:HEAT repeat protein
MLSSFGIVISPDAPHYKHPRLCPSCLSLERKGVLSQSDRRYWAVFRQSRVKDIIGARPTQSLRAGGIAMGKSKSVGEKRSELNALRETPKSPQAVTALRRALSDRSSRVVSKAAEIVGEGEVKELESELIEAYQRFLVDPAKSDLGCEAKTAIVEALVNIECREIEFYRAGIKYVQYEPIWGGEEDAAAHLRSASAMGLVLCASLLECLDRFAELLADHSKTARIGAARALAALAHPEGAPLVRLKLLLGDKDAEVLGECCSTLLRLSPDAGLPLVLERLASPDPNVAVQVAMALAESRNRRAFEPLRTVWRQQRDPEARSAMLIAIALLRSSEANEFLLSLLEGSDSQAAIHALRALKIHGKSGDLRQQIEAAVRRSGNEQLVKLLQHEFR